jgi:hypothetical protein
MTSGTGGFAPSGDEQRRIPEAMIITLLRT